MTTFDQALALARQLSRADQARLVSRLVTELAVAQEPAAAKDVADAWAGLMSFWQEIEALGTAAPSATKQLFDDRHTREEALEGHDYVHS